MPDVYGVIFNLQVISAQSRIRRYLGRQVVECLLKLSWKGFVRRGNKPYAPGAEYVQC